MVEVTSNVSRSSYEDHLLVLGVFLISGFLSGLMFGWLVSRPELLPFFYINGDKFLIPRYSYWFAFSLIHLLGLVGGFSVCRWRKWLDPICSRGRLMVAALVIGLATPFLRFMTPLMNAVMGLTWDVLVAPIEFLVLVSFAMCVLTGRLRLLPIAAIWNLIFGAVGFVMVYVSVRVLNVPNTWYELVQWSILESMLFLSIASWIVWRQRSDMWRSAFLNCSQQHTSELNAAEVQGSERTQERH
jgi:hypothetical protein